MPDLLMPKLSESMEAGVILTWIIGDGQRVAQGDELVEIETDKTTVTHTSDADGFLRIVAPEGTQCDVGEVIARIVELTASADNIDESDVLQPSKPEVIPFAAVESPPTSVAVRSELTFDSSPTSMASPTATPLARRAALIHGIPLDSVKATGPKGRVTQSDVLIAAGAPPMPLRVETEFGGAARGVSMRDRDIAMSGERGDTYVLQLTQLQKVVAERMAIANAIPTFQVQTDVILDEVIAMRERLKNLPEVQAVPSLNDFVIKACALAVRGAPLANASFTPEGFEYHGRVNVGFAVATEGSLIVPTIFDADIKTLTEIAVQSRSLAERCRSSTITPSELTGGTFTISNLGMFGMTAITPVINPPQAAILGVGATRGILTRIGGEIVDQTLVTLTLSCDHRILYGADASRLLAAIRDLLENPLMFLL
jgi:pyruvate dehydrogenase E2 component (dihydrolipoamide acetyltransferase)